MSEPKKFVVRTDTKPTLSLIVEEEGHPQPVTTMLKSPTACFLLVYYPGQSVLDRDSGWISFFCVKWNNPCFNKKNKDRGLLYFNTFTAASGFEIKQDNSPCIATPNKVYVHGDYQEYKFKPHLFKIGDVSQADEFVSAFAQALEELEQETFRQITTAGFQI